MNSYSGDQLPAHVVEHHVEPYAGYRYPAASGAGESADLRHILALLRDKLWLIVIAMLVGGALGFLYSRGAQPVYSTSASVWLESPNYQQGPLRASAALQGPGWAHVLESNAVLEPVVHQFKLYASRISPPGPSSILDGLEVGPDLSPGAFQLHLVGDDDYQLLDLQGNVLEEGALADGVGSTRGFHWVPDPAALRTLPEDLQFAVRRPIQAAQALNGRFDVRYEPLANVILTELRWGNPEECAAIHNAIIESFTELAGQLTNGRLRDEVDVLERQLGYAAARLRDAELALENFRVDAITEPGEPQMAQVAPGVVARDPFYSTYFQQRSDLDQIETDMDELQALRAAAREGSINLLRLRLVPSAQQHPTITSTINQLDKLELDRGTLLYTYTTDHPSVDSLTQVIETTKTEQLPALIGELMEDLENRHATLQNQLVQRSAELREIPIRTIEQTRLERRFNSAESLYQTLLSRYETANLAVQTALTNVQPLDAAFAPGGPVPRTKPQFYMLLGSLVGLGLVVGGVLVRDRLDNRIRHPDEISEKFGLPLLGVVPQLRSPDSNKAAQAVAVESFRSIRTQLSHAYGGAGGRVLITSSTPREGKSVVAANLAISYASAGLRTLLVDSDVRRGRLHAVFHFPRSPGLTEHLAGQVSLENVCRKHEVSGLDIICSGALSTDSEIIGGRKLDDFLLRARESYDVVVIDGPPLAAGADALILGQRCDQVVMVFRAGATSEGMARSRLGQLGNVDLPIVGAVLNAVPEHAPYYDQYVNYYYYAEAEAS